MHIRGWISLIALAVVAGGNSLQAQVVPGTGTKLTGVGDDFEDETWTYTYNLPKASSNIDKVDRLPAGASSNMRWLESTYRGTPDFLKRVDTPAGGLPGSKGAMAIQTLNSGIPGQRSFKFQQDDLIANLASTIGYLPANRTPSVVTRIYMPDFDQWEERNGSQFGFRIDCQTMIDQKPSVRNFFRRASGGGKQMEPYWPGMFIQFNRKEDLKVEKDSAMILIRSGSRGEDLPGPTITQPGWWTLGMTVTPDGSVHYYAHEGVAPLTPRDHLYSGKPYGYTALQMNTFFFNIVNQDDGRTWSTRFIVDDTDVFVLR